MATDKIDIWNMAIATCGSSSTISAADENSQQANLCRLWYDRVRRFVLGGAPWGCALKWANLAVIVQRDFSEIWTSADPAPGWAYAYGLPNDMIAPFYLHSFEKFEIGTVGGQRALMTNAEAPILRYVMDETTESKWDDELIEPIIAMLAYRIAPQINAKLGQRDRLKEDAIEMIVSARTRSANAEELQYDAVPEAIAARGYSGQPVTERFFFPFADMNGVSA